MGIFLRLGGQFLVAVTGMPLAYLQWVMTILLVLILIYTVLGGMLSVLVTDFLQFIVKGAGIVVTSLIVIHAVGWGHLLDGLWNSFAHPAAGAAHTLKYNPFNPIAAWGWDFIIWQMFFQLAAVTTWQTQVSRVLSARDESTAKRMYRRSAFYFVGRFALPGLWGAAAAVYFSQHAMPASLLGLTADELSLQATPTYLGSILPVGFIGLLLAAALAAEMSTDSGYLLTWATVIYNDLITPCLRKPLSPSARLLLTRSLVLAIGIFLLFYGLWYKLPGNAWGYLTVTGSIYLSSVFTLLVAALYWPRGNANGALAALVLGAVGPITFLVLKAVIPAWATNEAVAGASSFALAFAGMFFGSILTEAPNPSSNSTPIAEAA